MTMLGTGRVGYGRRLGMHFAQGDNGRDDDDDVWASRGSYIENQSCVKLNTMKIF